MAENKIIEEIRSKVDIVAVVSEYVRLRKAGKNHLGLCPFHSEKTPSFTVSQDKQLFHCFGCHEGGNVFTFLMKIENISFPEALKELGEKTGIKVERPSSSSSIITKPGKEKSYEVMSLALQFFKQQLEASAGKPALDYLTQRGINPPTVKTFSLGTAPEEWDSLFKYLISRGASPEQIESAGLTLPRGEKGGYYDRFRNRLIFPVFDLRGRVIAFSGRALKDEEPKYLNSPDTPIYQKGENIFGLHLSKEGIKKEKFAVLVEGNLDLVTAYQAGIENVAAPLGTALTPAQCKLLSRFTDTVVIAFDADTAGSTAAERSTTLLRTQGLNVKIAEMGKAKDPDELIRKEGGAAFVKVIQDAQPFLAFKIKRAFGRQDISGIEGRSKALREIAGILNLEVDPFIQKEYATIAAEKLKIETELILTEAKRLKFYKKSAEKDLRRVTEKPASKLIEAEKNLIAIALQSREALDFLRREMKAEDFSFSETKVIADKLLNTEFDESCPPEHFLIDRLSDEAARKLLTQLLLSEAPKDPSQVLQDCIKVIKSGHVQKRVLSLRTELSVSEKAGDFDKSALLLESLKSEIYS